MGDIEKDTAFFFVYFVNDMIYHLQTKFHTLFSTFHSCFSF